MIEKIHILFLIPLFLSLAGLIKIARDINLKFLIKKIRSEKNSLDLLNERSLFELGRFSIFHLSSFTILLSLSLLIITFTMLKSYITLFIYIIILTFVLILPILEINEYKEINKTQKTPPKSLGAYHLISILSFVLIIFTKVIPGKWKIIYGLSIWGLSMMLHSTFFKLLKKEITNII